MHGARQVASFHRDLAAKANTFCEVARFVRIDNERIDIIQYLLSHQRKAAASAKKIETVARPLRVLPD
jgi:hypothetical protein